MNVVISLDLGTTGNRTIAWGENGEIVAQSYSKFTQFYPNPSWVEHDAEEIWQTCIKTLKDVLAKLSKYTICSIGITNQRETVVMWDKHTGKPLYNAIVWQCRRTQDLCNQYKTEEKTIKSKTGLSLDPYFSATKIKWLLDKLNPNLDTTKVGTIDSWILYKLTNGLVHKTDATNASRTLLMNLNTLNYDTDLCSLFNIPTHILPEIHPSIYDFGETDSKIVGSKIPITAIIGDQQASFFAQAGAKSGTLKNTYGTGSFLMAGIGESAKLDPNLITTVALSTKTKTYYAYEGSIFIAGAAINWLRDNLGLISQASQTNTINEQCSSTEGVYFVPALAGLGSPYWAPDAKGIITGLTQKSTHHHIIRATIESLAYQSYDVISLFEKSFKSSLKDLWVDGGVSNNPFLLQFQADILQKNVIKTNQAEMTALGVAGLAGIGCKLWSLDQFLSLKKTDKTYKPTMDFKTIKQNIAGWKHAVKQCLVS
jgi:glycerol kinase